MTEIGSLMEGLPEVTDLRCLATLDSEVDAGDGES